MVFLHSTKSGEVCEVLLVIFLRPEEIIIITKIKKLKTS
jgi:hypothetical protein